MVVILSFWCITAKVRHEFTRRPVNVDRAGAALTVIAALFRTRQLEVFPQGVEQGHPRLERRVNLAPVNVQRHRHRAGGGWLSPPRERSGPAPGAGAAAARVLVAVAMLAAPSCPRNDRRLKRPKTGRSRSFPSVASLTNSKPPPGGSGSSRTQQSPYCPCPPLCFLCRPWALAPLRMVSR